MTPLEKIAADYKAGKTAKYTRLQKTAQRIATKECNGEYPTESKYTIELNTLHSSFLRALGLEREDAFPKYITYTGDPRGAVTKILAEKLSNKDMKMLEEAGLRKDWGGDFMLGCK